MTLKVAINGYGRIGRNVLRAHYESGKKHDLAIVAVNDLGSAETNAHLTRYDTVHGKFPGTVEVEGDASSTATASAFSRSATPRSCPGERWTSMSSSNARACLRPRRRPRDISRAGRRR